MEKKWSQEEGKGNAALGEEVAPKKRETKSGFRKGEENMESIAVRKREKMQSTAIFITTSY